MTDPLPDPAQQIQPMLPLALVPIPETCTVKQALGRGEHCMRTLEDLVERSTVVDGVHVLAMRLDRARALVAQLDNHYDGSDGASSVA